MNTEAPAPQLLSDKRLVEIRAHIEANYTYYPKLERIAELDEEGDFVLEADALLVHLAAYRLKVAEQLRGLLTEADIMAMIPPADRTRCFIRNTQVQNAAKALGIKL